jgi:putative ABC transport system substrate-binding protein
MPADPIDPRFRRDGPSARTAAAALGVKAMAVPIRTSAEIEPAIERLAREPNGGLILPTDSFTRLRYGLIAEEAARRRLSSIAAQPEFAREGGLLSYGQDINLIEQYRQLASYVDRILKGAKPGELPIQRGNKFTLIINLKTAEALGIEVPPTLLARADEVIE